ncbi:MAG TPA: transglycosylase, partial [Burkholderiaceae bacterium]
MTKLLRYGAMALIVGILAACSSPPPQPPATTAPGTSATPPPGSTALPQGRSRWVPVPWSDLPGFADDSLFEAWNAWVKSCARPAPAFAALCGDVRRLSIADAGEQRAWMVAHL